MMTAAQIRTEFLKFFEKHGHTVVESAGLVPHNDPTLLFTAAGMVQFKDVFLGTDPRPYKRAATAQKCLRAGGKHNDLENVGFTARHHTFFEMLGNFSFGDYFKKEAIKYGWEFVTKNLGIDKSRLYVTVFRTDDEAAQIWEKQEGVPKERIFRFDEKDNFWAAGDTGPCGPCSEIFVDRGEKYGCGKPTCKVGCDCDRYMEIWNLVFMQYDRDKAGNLNPLPKPSVDTGSGLERVAAVVQGVDSNYDIDLFRDLIQNIAALSKKKYEGANDATKASIRVIADHCRATNFLIADGVLPSNEGRGYVLRRIMRRAIRHGRNLGFREPFFYKLTATLIKVMGDAYPELKDKREFLESTIKMEEERFLITLENGLKVLEDEMAKAGSSKTLPGPAAFKLYDTFGFPFDLTEVIARERGFKVDEAGFKTSMETQRERSREHWKGSGDDAVSEVFKSLQQKGLRTTFKGYETLSSDGKVLAIVEEGKVVEKTSTGSFQVVLDQTPFYAESGGQAGDKGEISASGFKAKVTDVSKPAGNMIVLHCEDATGQLKTGAVVQQNTNKQLRGLTMKNHTATHMLHHALRKFLGPHVKQAGSLVNAELLRFDFNHTKPMTDDELLRVEDFINESIAAGDAVHKDEMEKDEAIAKGAIAFFGDKYGSKVRVVSVGDYSTELCGGTHVSNTAEIQMFKILNESGVAAGVRRIIAVTGPAVLGQLREKERQLRLIMGLLRASAPAEVPIKIEKLVAEEKALKKALENQSRKSSAGELDRWISEAITINGGKLIKGVAEFSEGENPSKALRDMADLIRSKVQKSVVALATSDKAKGQTMLLVAVTKDLVETYKANDIIRQVAPIIGGSGGGKPDMAQAGGKLEPEGEGSNENFSRAFLAIQNLLKV